MKQLLIVGGGAIGSAIAYFLASHYPGHWQITVLERDPAYTFASSALSASSIRQQFSQPVNIQMSAYGWWFLQQAHQVLALGDDQPDLQLQQRAYAYLASNQAAAEILRHKQSIQLAAGAHIALLTPEQLALRFPWLYCGDLELASLGLANEGWFDGYALLMALKNKARQLGVRYVQGEALAWRAQGRQLSGVELADGKHLQADCFINAAGAWSAKIADPSGFTLPISARRRTVFVLSSPARTPDSPLLIDPTGLWCRPEGKYWICGLPSEADPDDMPLEPDYSQWQTVWEILAHRIPAMSALRMERAWAGYYEMNTFDQNGLLGWHPQFENLWLACGFSGHGLQHAPALGLASAEYLQTGAFQTLDLSALSPKRILTQQALLELNVI